MFFPGVKLYFQSFTSSASGTSSGNQWIFVGHAMLHKPQGYEKVYKLVLLTIGDILISP